MNEIAKCTSSIFREWKQSTPIEDEEINQALKTYFVKTFKKSLKEKLPKHFEELKKQKKAEKEKEAEAKGKKSKKQIKYKIKIKQRGE